MKQWHNAAICGLMMGGSFLLGQWFMLRNWMPQGADLGASPMFGSAPLLAQGRGPDNPPPVRPTVPPPATPPVVYPEDSGQSAMGNGFLAVTGSYGVGTSVLYVIDTVNRQLAVYEARGGTESMRRIVLVGARKMDLDLMLESYNDRSEYDYRKLKQVFERRGEGTPDVGTGLEPTPDAAKEGGK